jgi:hypothetical protein
MSLEDKEKNLLWQRTNQICPRTMLLKYEKQINQEDFYCGVDSKYIHQAVIDANLKRQILLIDFTTHPKHFIKLTQRSPEIRALPNSGTKNNVPYNPNTI